MKADIHPKYQKCTITCVCGSEFPTRSTRESYKVDLCGDCHPFYTGDGSMRLIDAAGRIEKFRRRYNR